MPERTGREFAQAFQDMLVSQEFDRFREFLRPDCVHEYPQSGERFVGIDNIRAVFENYPGGLGVQELASLRVAGEERPWAIAPNFTLVKVTGSGDRYTSAVKARYPDGSDWYVISMIELVDGLMAHATMFFAPVFEAPEWRKPYAEAGAGS
jgi:SnoaL-like domain